MTNRALIAGFDSAWTRTNRGAIAFVAIDGARRALVAPVTADFELARRLIAEASAGREYVLVCIDQPLVVPNAERRRPVECGVAPAIARRGGAIQPAYRGRESMFGDGAPIWAFLAAMGDRVDPSLAVSRRSGVHCIEVYPTLTIAALFPQLRPTGRLPKYNPVKANFSIDDWRGLCSAVGHLGTRLLVEGAAEWCRAAAGLVKPRKQDQDKLDAVICALIGCLAFDRDASMVIIGDAKTGYIVAPTNPELRRELEADSEKVRVLLRPIAAIGDASGEA